MRHVIERCYNSSARPFSDDHKIDEQTNTAEGNEEAKVPHPLLPPHLVLQPPGLPLEHRRARDQALGRLVQDLEPLPSVQHFVNVRPHQVVHLGQLFGGAPRPLPCADGVFGHPSNQALLDVDGDQQSNLTDAVFLLLYLFNNGAPPALGTECLQLADCPDACAP